MLGKRVQTKDSKIELELQTIFVVSIVYNIMPPSVIVNRSFVEIEEFFRALLEALERCDNICMRFISQSFLIMLLIHLA